MGLFNFGLQQPIDHASRHRLQQTGGWRQIPAVHGTSTPQALSKNHKSQLLFVNVSCTVN
jgi:hypothetical protein